MLNVNAMAPNIVMAIPVRTQASNISCCLLINQPKIVRKIPELWIIGDTTDTGATASAINLNMWETQTNIPVTINHPAATLSVETACRKFFGTARYKAKAAVALM